MNERINELIKQSYVTVRSQNDREVTYFSQEKFAELIVKECADHIDNLVTCDDDGNQILDCDDVRTELLEHFGVEE